MYTFCTGDAKGMAWKEGGQYQILGVSSQRISALLYHRGITSALRLPCAMITASTISMPSRITPQQYGQAVLEHVQTGVYPESEEVISADFPPSALPEVSKLIEQAREDVKVCIYGHCRAIKGH